MAGRRSALGDLAVLGAFGDAAEAQRKQLSLHRAEPAREILLVCAEWKTLEIQEIRWAGIKCHSAVLVSEEDWWAISETLHLVSLPGMAVSIRKGLKTPVGKCADEPAW